MRKMNCIISGANIKVLSRTVQALAKIGDELYMEAKPDYLSFTSINMMKTAFATFHFFDSFFSSYVVEDAVPSENVSCKIPMKSILSILKFKPQKEKKIEMCKIELQSNSTKIVFKLRYKHDLTVVHALNLIDYETLSVSYNKDSNLNWVQAPGQLFTHVLSNFQMYDTDMSLEIFKDRVVMRNYDTSLANFQRGIRSQITLMGNEFSHYDIKQETNVTLSLKPFRSAIHFAELFNLNVSLQLETGGKPSVLKLNSTTFEGNFVMATVNPDGTTQSTMTGSSIIRQTKNDKSTTNITMQDKEVVVSINWDNDDDFQMTPKRKRLAKENEKEVDTSEIISSNFNENVDLDVLPSSPESPRMKRAKVVFGRCNEATFHTTMLDLGAQLAANSDSDETTLGSP